MVIDLLHEEEYAELSKRQIIEDVPISVEQKKHEELNRSNANYRNRSFQVLLVTLGFAFLTVLIALIVLIQI